MASVVERKLQHRGFNGDGRTDRVTRCRDARPERPLSNESYSIVVLTGTDAQTVRPYKGLLVSL